MDVTDDFAKHKVRYGNVIDWCHNSRMNPGTTSSFQMQAHLCYNKETNFGIEQEARPPPTELRHRVNMVHIVATKTS